MARATSHSEGRRTSVTTRPSLQDRPSRPGTPLRKEVLPTDISLFDSIRTRSQSPNSLHSLSHSTLILEPVDMKTTRSFSYASVKEQEGEIPQSFEASLSSEDLEEVEWIAWPCSQWCKTKGLCSYHSGGTHDDYVEARLDGYAKNAPRKLAKILEEIEKRGQAQKLGKLPPGTVVRIGRNRSDSGLDFWRSKLRKVYAPSPDEEADSAILDGEVDLPMFTPRHRDLSPLEILPNEIQDLIFSYVQVDHTADPYARPHTDLCSCALVSKNLRAAATRVMYQHVSIPQSKAFSKFLRSLAEDSELGQFVHWLDFSHYSNMGFGRARSTSTRTPFLTPTTIRECLNRLPMLQAFLVHEHVDDELDVQVISKLFRMPSIQALDFTACSSKPFTEAFSTVCTLVPWRDNSMISLGSWSHPLKRLSLHECTTLQEPVFEALLPRLSNLTHLDVAHTLINDKALESIPYTAQITHLNIERCTRLTGSTVVRFLTTHPAAKDTMVYLNIMSDSSRHRLLGEYDTGKLLPCLPSTLRSLNIGGAKVTSAHVPHLRHLATHLEELGLKGADLGLAADINRIFGIGQENEANATTLKYIDLTDIKAVTQMSLSYNPTALTGTTTDPLEVIELGSSVVSELQRRNAKVTKPEWVVRELGRRGWYVRQPKPSSSSDDSIIDDGSRAWKMGARWWGMRKIPMVAQDVGGMYGYFMFKRN